MKLFFIFTFLFFSTVSDGSTKRNVLIFMAADNDLEEYARRDLVEIEQAIASNDNLNLNIEVHLKNESWRRSLTGAQSSDHKITAIKDPKKSLTSFLEYAIDPSVENILIIWGHGQGPKERGDNKSFGGVFTNSENYSSLNTRDLGDILKSFQIEMLIFDMCLMQNLTVLKHISAGPGIVIGSAQIQNLIGLPYNLILPIINSPMPTDILAKNIVNQTALNMPNKNYTFSAIYNGEHNHILDHLTSLNIGLREFLLHDSYNEFIYSTYFIDLPAFPGDYYDIGMYLGILKKMDRENNFFSRTIRRRIKLVQESLNFSIIEKEYGTEYTDGTKPYYAEYFQGLSITKDFMIIPENLN